MECDLPVRDFQHQAIVPFFVYALDDNVLNICAIRDIKMKNDFRYAKHSGCKTLLAHFSYNATRTHFLSDIERF